MTIVEHDLRRPLPADVADVACVLSILTLQFVPIEHRLTLLGRLYDRMKPGATLLLSEKVLGSDPKLDALLTRVYLDMKRAHGYSAEEVERKRLALEGVLVPVTAKWNEDMLRSTGFRHVDCVWRCGNFAAWLAVKADVA